jgi:two-component system response regulator YesN
VRAHTAAEQRRLLAQVRLVIERHYARRLTVPVVARALATSPRQVQRAYAQFGDSTFAEDLRRRRMLAAAELLAQQAIPVRDVARLVGYRQAPHFAKAFRRRYGVTPARFRTQLRTHRGHSAADR